MQLHGIKSFREEHAHHGSMSNMTGTQAARDSAKHESDVSVNTDGSGPERPCTPPLHGDHSTVADAFEAAAQQHGARLAYVDGSVRLSFAEWYRRSDTMAHGLVALGVRPGDVVVMMLPSGTDYAIAYGAIELAGAIATGVNPRLGRREIEAVIAVATPRLVLHDPAAFDPATMHAVTMNAVAAGGQVVGLVDVIAAARGVGLGSERPCRQPNDAAVIIWTSGTTGVPKGAWFDHRGLFAAVASAGVMSAPYDVKLAGTPFPHAGYAAKLWDQLAWGSSNVVPPTPWSAGDMLRLLVDEQITVAAGVPTQWAKLLEEPGLEGADLSHVRVGLVATAPASPELVERVSRSIGCPLVVRYAMTESPSITGTEPDDPPEVQFQTVGRPQRGMEVIIVDGDGNAVAPGVVGRVRLRGACVMRGYWNDPERTRAVLDDHGWLTSSDIGRIDHSGNLVLAGRVDDMYIRGGYNVYPLEVENVLAEHPGVARAAVVGTPADAIGEIGVAFVTPVAADNPPNLAELRAWVAERLADYKAPDRLVLLAELPQTAMMKIDKVALARQAAATTDDRKTNVNTNTTTTAVTETSTSDGEPN
jgi:acyl-CoA synthetase (AMP-forming)/AMP-acid ligase II